MCKHLLHTLILEAGRPIAITAGLKITKPAAIVVVGPDIQEYAVRLVNLLSSARLPYAGLRVWYGPLYV